MAQIPSPAHQSQTGEVLVEPRPITYRSQTEGSEQESDPRAMHGHQLFLKHGIHPNVGLKCALARGRIRYSHRGYRKVSKALVSFSQINALANEKPLPLDNRKTKQHISSQLCRKDPKSGYPKIQTSPSLL